MTVSWKKVTERAKYMALERDGRFCQHCMKRFKPASLNNVYCEKCSQVFLEMEAKQAELEKKLLEQHQTLIEHAESMVSVILKAKKARAEAIVHNLTKELAPLKRYIED